MAERGGDKIETCCLKITSSWLGLLSCYKFNFSGPIGWCMDQITIKTPNPKCRLYWCLIEFMDWRYSQSCWYFRPAL
jgi:hypothetical protein